MSITARCFVFLVACCLASACQFEGGASVSVPAHQLEPGSQRVGAVYGETPYVGISVETGDRTNLLLEMPPNGLVEQFAPHYQLPASNIARLFCDLSDTSFARYDKILVTLTHSEVRSTEIPISFSDLEFAASFQPMADTVVACMTSQRYGKLYSMLSAEMSQAVDDSTFADYLQQRDYTHGSLKSVVPVGFEFVPAQGSVPELLRFSMFANREKPQSPPFSLYFNKENGRLEQILFHEPAAQS